MRSIALACCVLLLAACQYTSVRQSPNYDHFAIKKGQILVLPAEAVVHNVRLLGSKERMYDYEYIMEDLATHTIAAELKKNGYHAIVLSKHDLHAQRLSNQFLDAQQNFNEAKKRLYAKKLHKKDAFAIAENVNPRLMGIQDRVDSYLLLCSYEGYSKSNSARVADIMMDVLLWTRASKVAEMEMLTVGIIKQDSGDIVWTNHVIAERSAWKQAYHNMGFTGEMIDRRKMRALAAEALAPLMIADE